MDKGTRALTPSSPGPGPGPTVPTGPSTGPSPTPSGTEGPGAPKPRMSLSADAFAHRKISTKSISSDSKSDTKSDTKSEQTTTAREEKAPDTSALSSSEFVIALLLRLLRAKVVDDSKTDRRHSESLEDGPPSRADVAIGASELRRLNKLAVPVLLADKCLIRIEKSVMPLLIVGDIHGQFIHLRSLFEMFGGPSETALLFLGDYVDRGVQGIECMALLLTMKIKYPSRVFMLRGNHEDANTTLSYGFHEECLTKYGRTTDGQSVWESFVSVFNVLPLAALVNKKIFCVHGGISPHMQTIDEIDQIIRPLLIPAFGLATDLVWADPDTRNNGWSLSPRGVSFVFDGAAVEDFCKRNGVDLIVRGHQISSDMHNNGYKFFCGGRLVTIFSAPNYLNYHNAASVLRVSREMTIALTVFRSSDDSEDADRNKREQFMKERDERRKARKKVPAPDATTPTAASDKKPPISDPETSTGDASEEDKEHSAKDLPENEVEKKAEDKSQKKSEDKSQKGPN